MAAYRWVYDSVTCRLTAKNRDQLPNPTLGNRVWATFTFVYGGMPHGIVVSIVQHINEGTLCCAQLVLGRVTICEQVYSLGM